MPDTLSSWLEWLEALHPHEIEMSLERVRTVVARAGLDRNLPKLITVAGTNGKGSVVEYLTRSYFCAGFRTGSYTSPHLHVFNERVRINGVNASDTLLCDAFASIEQARGDTTLTYFEYTTLVGCAYLLISRWMSPFSKLASVVDSMRLIAGIRIVL